ncbi:hypothetical protein [Mycolicibacterium goodii]|uniref:hypothetical protein n=1 Tax=Mycolicibacterium goodii TaxID=134601 RepID=UPI001BDCB688|nr:hypothetical protein [Mycolicibacterium goodii]MBU8833694.1 hypothetical protein [Mycolicibacterium goodii]ULN45132.1 hypothetical protein MI170_17255 [Mycolicibacterium goodii]
MTDNRTSPAPVTTRRPRNRIDTPADIRPSIRARVTARMRATTLDAALAVGAPTPPGSAIAVRAERLTSRSERKAIARTLRRAVRDAASDIYQMTSRAPLHRNNIADCRELIETIARRLHEPAPVSARGMARLRRVISDGCGPMYAMGRGDLAGRLGAALAAL